MTKMANRNLQQDKKRDEEKETEKTCDVDYSNFSVILLNFSHIKVQLKSPAGSEWWLWVYGSGQQCDIPLNMLKGS